jgi:hypothetical protein
MARLVDNPDLAFRLARQSSRTLPLQPGEGEGGSERQHLRVLADELRKASIQHLVFAISPTVIISMTAPSST